MPLYAYKCHHCGNEFDRLLKLADHRSVYPCTVCGALAQQRITPIHVMGDIPEYRSVATGEVVSGRQAHREHLRRHGLVEVGNEPIRVKGKPLDPIGPDIKDAIERVKSGQKVAPARNFLDSGVVDKALSEI